MSRVVDISVRHAKTKVSAVSVQRVVHALDKLKGYRCPEGSLSIAFLGDKAYGLLLRSNILLNAVRRRMKLPYWSLSAHMKRKVKNAVEYVCNFEDAVAREAHERGLDGVVCGHIHTAALHDDFGLRYINCGDWVESCTAAAENMDGTFEIITWTHSGGGLETAEPEARARAA